MAAVNGVAPRQRVVAIVESVECHFTKEELLEKGKAVAMARHQIERLEEDKKRSSKHYDGLIAEEEAIISSACNEIRDGYERRRIDCGWHMHDPELGMKTLYRMDTGEEVRSMKMDERECQEELFEPEPVAEATGEPSEEQAVAAHV